MEVAKNEKETMLNASIEYSRNSLIDKLESLIKSCQYEVDRLKNDENYKPNSLGIIQYNSIDVECAKLYTLHEAKEILKSDL